MEKILRYYQSQNGKSQLLEWLESLKDILTRSRIERRLMRLSFCQYGDSKSITNSISELRLHFGSGYRIYFTETKDEIVLLCGGDKSTQEKDIEKAKKIFKELEQENHVEN